MTAAAVSSDHELVQAIHDNRLSDWARDIVGDNGATDEQRAHAELAAATCATIHATMHAEADRLSLALIQAGVSSTTRASDQRHSLVVDIDVEHVDAAMEVLRDLGYDGGRLWAGGAARSFVRNARNTTFTRSAGRSTVVQLRLQRDTKRRATLPTKVRRALTPTPADWAIVDLPASLSWAYRLIRPLRLIAERLGLMSTDHGDLEPFLVTPDSLLDPLLDVARVGAADVFADIGCGDGRIVCAAAQRRGCRALGIEQSAESSADALRRVDELGVADRVDIIRVAAREADLSAVTVALFFVPMVVATRLIPDMLERLAPGGRVVLHEQSALAPTIPRPDDSVAIIAADAVTVAHLWHG